MGKISMLLVLSAMKTYLTSDTLWEAPMVMGLDSTVADLSPYFTPTVTFVVWPFVFSE